MPRRKRITKKKIMPDSKYNDLVISKFINLIMEKGKKSLAESICYQALNLIKEKTKEEPLKVFKKAVENVRPSLEVKSRRVGGATYQVPIEVRSNRRMALSLRWIVNCASSRKENKAYERLALELIEAFNNTGLAVKKKVDTHRMADANRAFAHYRW